MQSACNSRKCDNELVSGVRSHSKCTLEQSGTRQTLTQSLKQSVAAKLGSTMMADENAAATVEISRVRLEDEFTIASAISGLSIDEQSSVGAFTLCKLFDAEKAKEVRDEFCKM